MFFKEKFARVDGVRRSFQTAFERCSLRERVFCAEGAKNLRRTPCAAHKEKRFFYSTDSCLGRPVFMGKRLSVPLGSQSPKKTLSMPI